MTLNDIFAGRYRLTRHLGTGGFAQVWLAEDQMAEDAVVAIKIYAPERGLDENGVKIFRREFALTVPLNHPHLLKSFHFDVYQGSPYLIMPFCQEGSLMSQVVDQYTFSEQEIAEILSQIADGLAYLHSKDICHQDVKPDNVLILEPGKYVLSDFGISSKTRRTIAKSMRADQAGSYSAFTPAYAPPEKYTSKPTAAGDVFSLGVTLYELATHDVPFADIGMALKEGARVPDLPQPYSRELNQLLQSCLNVDPEERPTASQLREAAFHFLRNRSWPGTRIEAPSGAKRRRVTEKMPEPPVLQTSGDDPNKTLKKREKRQEQGTSGPKKRNYWPLIAGFFVVAVVAGRTAWVEVKERKEEKIRQQFYLSHQTSLSSAKTLEDSIEVYKNSIGRSSEPPLNELVSDTYRQGLTLGLSVAESKKKKREEQAKTLNLKPLSQLLAPKDQQKAREEDPTGSSIYDQLTLNTGCKSLYLDLEKGTLNGLTPKATQEEVKKALPCFSKVVSPLVNAKGAEVFFEKQQFCFKTAQQGIEVYRYFTGKVSMPILNKSEAQVLQMLGKQPLFKTGKVKGYEDYVFTKDYGTLVVGFSASECTRIKVYHTPALLIPKASNF